MRSPTKVILLIIGLIALFILTRYGCYAIDETYDTFRRPWAYSDDPDKALLIGKWQGSVTNPDRVLHKVEMEIFVPRTDEERLGRLFQARSTQDRSSPTFFDGMAIVEVNGRRDSCEIWGGLDEPDGHQIQFQFRPFYDKHPTGFNLSSAVGNWQENSLELDVSFAFFLENGTSYADSADPRYEQKGKMVMTRTK